MFAAKRWAEAFILACEGDSKELVHQCEAGLALFKAAFNSLSRLRLPASGSAAAAEFNGFLGRSLQKCGYEGAENGVESARAIIFLLIQHSLFQHTGLLIDEIEDLLLKKQNILTVLLDCAEKPDDDFLLNLRNLLKKRENVNDARITVVLMPELIGGYRINIGGTREDFSVAGQMTRMKRALTGV
ncbi:MAG: F0F1 ATP synthase subunit delta [Spirochaetaceae bacterium]|jgi:hypothetical protein|nr:F0F1 ATP synthase subunit delta [Spirochaetaceae bacterium]